MKKLYITIIICLFARLSFATCTLTGISISSSNTICAGTTIEVNYMETGCQQFVAGNFLQFIITLSDEFGNFGSGETILREDDRDDGTLPLNWTVTIPQNIPSSNNYRLKLSTSSGSTIIYPSPISVYSSGTVTVSSTIPGDPLNNIICNADIISVKANTIGGSANPTFLWSTGATADSIIVSPTISTFYNVTVNFGGGCSIVDYKSVSVLPQNIIRSPDLTGLTACGGLDIELRATAFSSRIWSNGSTVTPIRITPTKDTSISVTVFNNYLSCKDTFNLEVIDPVSISSVTANKDTVSLNDNEVTLTAFGTATNYSWDNGSTSAIITVNPTQTTSYYLRSYIDSINCLDLDTIIIVVRENNNPTSSSINNSFHKKEFSIFPNPSNGKFYIKKNKSNISSYFILNSLGQELKKIETYGNDLICIDATELPNGLYTLTTKQEYHFILIE